MKTKLTALIAAVSVIDDSLRELSSGSRFIADPRKGAGLVRTMVQTGLPESEATELVQAMRRHRFEHRHLEVIQGAVESLGRQGLDWPKDDR